LDHPELGAGKNPLMDQVDHDSCKITVSSVSITVVAIGVKKQFHLHEEIIGERTAD
jgi:hypothetical protein